MKRQHLIELHEQNWCLSSIRNGVRDMIQFISTTMPTYSGIIPQLKRAVKKSGTREVIDLCSGAGGPWKRLIESIPDNKNSIQKITLTDLFPDHKKFKDIKNSAKDLIDYSTSAVDATNVPEKLKGFL